MGDVLDLEHALARLYATVLGGRPGGRRWRLAQRAARRVIALRRAEP